MGLLFTDKDDDFGAISDGAKPRRSRKWSVTYRRGFVPYFDGV